VRQVAEDGLRAEEKSQRAVFLPAEVVRDAMQEDPSCIRKTLARAVKARVAEKEISGRSARAPKTRSHDAIMQGRSSRGVDANLPEGTWKFVLNAAHDTLSHNANLHLWRIKPSSLCPLCCAEPQSLVHVLNACKTALQLRRYNSQHDAELYSTIKISLPEGTRSLADLDTDYTFPSHLAPTDLRPDVVWWNDTTKRVTLLELKIPFDTLLEDAARRKQAKY
jgi:hypothetical protein